MMVVVFAPVYWAAWPFTLQPTSDTADASAHAVADALNARFAKGAPADRLEDAGVLLHTLDGSENPDHPWRATMYANGRRLRRAFFSVSLVNAHSPGFYTFVGGPNLPALSGFAGLVYESGPSTLAHVNALMPMDGATQANQCYLTSGPRCIAGQPSKHCPAVRGCVVSRPMWPSWKVYDRTELAECMDREQKTWGCYYTRSELRLMMWQQLLLAGGSLSPENDYNEIIVESNDTLRPLVVAVFVRAQGMCTISATRTHNGHRQQNSSSILQMLPNHLAVLSYYGMECGASDADLAFARSVQAKLLADGVRVPILSYDRSSATVPFAVV